MTAHSTQHRFLDRLPASVQSMMLRQYEDQHLESLRRSTMRRRDSAIFGCFIEIVVSVAAMALYDIRRSILVPIVNLGLVALSVIGLNGAMKLGLRNIQIHGVITTGLIIACLFNFLAEAFLTHAGVGSDTLPSWLVLLLLFVPYSLNLGCSVLSLLLAGSYAEFLEAEEEMDESLSGDAMERQLQASRGQDLCCICMERRKDAVFTPCGHRATCCSCGDKLQARSRRCPVCRSDISNVQRVFDS
mmetsp:Transcript_75527/g.225148  ORF Transcript_75527/g.225148 Transcript_75527/m.225148 type:complete len:245 (-) Transcript_75527:96-830(-)